MPTLAQIFMAKTTCKTRPQKVLRNQARVLLCFVF